MTKNKTSIIGTFTSIICIILVSGLLMSFKDDKRNFEISKNLDIFNSLYKELDLFYVDSVKTEVTIKRGIDAMLAGLDPYTNYIPESEREDFKLMTTGEYGGIGSVIMAKDGKVIISDPQEGMPAQLAGLKAGDIILEINGISMDGKKVSEASEMLKGTANTKLKLKIRRPGEINTFEKEITRRKIQMNAVPYYGMMNDSIGYILLSSFTDKAAMEVKAALLDLKKNNQLKGLVLDLRNNPGGILEDAVQIVNFFLPKGKEVLSTRGKVKQWDRTYITTQEPIDPDIPLAVMVNSRSASASEIVAGALQDLDRAVIVGTRTFGKGLVQATRQLPYNGTLKVTTAKYYIPSGRCIQAIDYSRKNPDGSVGSIPDSLTSEFKTANGRLVKDGGGVSPDFEINPEKSGNIAFYLMNDFLFFDFATDYARRNPSIAPIKDFKISDQDFADFKEFVKSKNFTYDRQSERVLKELREVAKFEGYLEDSENEFKALEAKLNHKLDKDLDTFREEIEHYMSMEIVKRYYYQKGEIRQSLKNDIELKKSIEVLNDKSLYESTLNLNNSNPNKK